MLELLKQLLRRKPFSPIRIVMKSGERHDIVDPERVAIGVNQVFLCSQGEPMAWLKESEIELVYEPRLARQ